MSERCLSCRHFESLGNAPFNAGRCLQPTVDATLFAREETLPGYHSIGKAREICDKEGDGHFAYFEQKPDEPDRGYVPQDEDCRQMFREACQRIGL